MLWPPTPENLAIALPYLLHPERHSEFTLSVAIERLKGLKVARLTQPHQALIVPPYEIHAVISQGPCGHINKLYTDYRSLETWLDVHKQVLTAANELCEKQGNDVAIKNEIGEQFYSSKRAFNHWWALLERQPVPSQAEYRKRLMRLEETNTSFLRRYSLSKCCPEVG
jgi:hypothetical protein